MIERDTIELLTLMVRLYRRLRELGVVDMPLIEVKGLANAVQTARTGISDVRKAVGELQTSSSLLAVEAADVTAQLEQARKDLRFEAETLGNSGPPSNGAPSDGGEQAPPKAEPPQS